MPHFKFAAVVTEDNTQSIIDHASKFGLDISHQLEGAIESYAHLGQEPMAFLSYGETIHSRTAGFSVLGSKPFYQMYEFDYERGEGPFVQVHDL